MLCLPGPLQTGGGSHRPYRVDPRFGGPEYETIGALGSLCEIGDIKAIAKGNERCQQYGIDTISVGVCIAFAMECAENGILSSEATDGLDISFGNADAMLALIEKIGKREGIGQHITDSFPLSDLFDQREHGIGIAE